MPLPLLSRPRRRPPPSARRSPHLECDGTADAPSRAIRPPALRCTRRAAEAVGWYRSWAEERLREGDEGDDEGDDAGGDATASQDAADAGRGKTLPWGLRRLSRLIISVVLTLVGYIDMLGDNGARLRTHLASSTPYPAACAPLVRVARTALSVAQRGCTAQLERVGAVLETLQPVEACILTSLVWGVLLFVAGLVHGWRQQRLVEMAEMAEGEVRALRLSRH